MREAHLIQDRITRRLPPRAEYDDVPYFDNEHLDTVYTRALRAAWNELYKRDLLEITFAQIARECGISTPSLYHHFPSLADLAGAVAERAVMTLGVAMAGPDVGVPADRNSWPGMERESVRRYLRFAAKRPRHFALAYSGQFADPRYYPGVRRASDFQLRVMDAHLFFALGRNGSPEEVRGFHAVLHGSAALSAAGRPVDEDAVLVQVGRYLDSLRAPQNPYAQSFASFSSTGVGFDPPVQTSTAASGPTREATSSVAEVPPEADTAG